MQVLFLKASKYIKYQRIILTKYVQDYFLLKTMKIIQNVLSKYAMCISRKKRTVQGAKSSKLIYVLNAIPIKIPADGFW